VKQGKVLVVAANPEAPFIAQDIAMLQQRYNVSVIRWQGKRTAFRVLAEARRRDMVYCWFAGDHALASLLAVRLVGKRALLVAGGSEIGSDPRVAAAPPLPLLRRLTVRLSLRLARHVVAVSEKVASEAVRVAKRSRITVVPNGIDTEFFRPGGRPARRPYVVTVGYVDGNLKGLHTFAAAAALMPQVRCAIIGEVAAADRAALQRLANGRLRFCGRLERHELRAELQSAWVICQLSQYESFGMAAAEGTACGAVPVLAAGRTGVEPYLRGYAILAPYGDAAGSARAIAQALARARQRGTRWAMHHLVAGELPLSRRSEAILRLVEEIRAK
jgi:glycosyltransferase involved in cell wall biosynthesis